MRRSSNTATPFTARLLTVPLSVAPRGLPSSIVIKLSAPATGVPAESTMATRMGGVSASPACAPELGSALKTRATGVPWDNCPPPPLNSLSKWQPASRTTSAAAYRPFISYDERCKPRTPRACREASSLRHETAEWRQQVWGRHGRENAETYWGAGSGSFRCSGGYRSPLPAPVLEQAPVHVRRLLCRALPGKRPGPRSAALDQLLTPHDVVRKTLQCFDVGARVAAFDRSEEHTSELQSRL